jgi:hypothetical protein
VPAVSFSDEERGELIAALTDAVLTADGLLEACQRLTNALEWEPKPSTQQLEAARNTLAGWRKEIDRLKQRLASITIPPPARPQ